MRRYFEKRKEWIRTHRRSRRHAALQNLCFTLILFLLSAVLLRGYIAVNSVEATMEKWCEENLFGKAEIVAMLEYEEDKHQHKEIIISKETSDGERYEAKLHLLQENPWRWVCMGSSYGNTPKASRIDEKYVETYSNGASIIYADAIEAMFPEFIDYKFLHAAYTTVHIVEDEDTVNNSYQGFQVYIQYDYNHDEITPEILLYESTSFRMNLDTGEIEAVDFEPFELNGKETRLWLSEERMAFIAEKLMDAIPK